MIRLLKWTVFLAVIGVMVAPDIRGSTKLLTLSVGLVLVVLWLKGAFVRWIKSEDKAPAWDEIQSIPPIVPEPPFKGGGAISRTIINCFAKWPLSRAKKGDPDSFNAMGEMYEIGTKYTPKNAIEAMRWYLAAAGGDPTQSSGPLFAKQRIAEMYEDREGVPRDLDMAGRIYKTIPSSPSAMLHFAIAHVEGRGVPQDYIEGYKLLLTADRFYSMHPPSKKEVETDVQKHRENHRHIRVRELMAILEARMSPEQLIKASEAARGWWNAHR